MKTDIISRMEAMQSRFGSPTEDETLQSLTLALGGEGDSRPLQLEVGEYYDRIMRERGDNGTLDYLSDEDDE